MKKKKKEKQTLRGMLIDAIFEFSADEWFEADPRDFINLAKESEEQLADRVITILEWYRDNQYGD